MCGDVTLQAEGGGGRSLGGDLNLHVSGPHTLQSISNRLVGEFGAVAIPAQVSEVEVLKIL